MSHLIHEPMMRELAADRERVGRDERRCAEDAHRRQVERVRASVELVPRARAEAPRGA